MRFPHIRSTGAVATFAIAVLLGQITDATTGQPLSGVHVSAAGKRAVTDHNGHYRIALPDGRYTLTWQSADVPMKAATVTVRAKSTVYDIKACSTTLDYSCGGELPSSGAGTSG